MIEDDDADEMAERGSDLGSNPDEMASQNNSDDEQGEDLDENWIE